MNRITKKLAVAFMGAVLSFVVSGDEMEISSGSSFTKYCGTGINYKNYDRLILTANITLESDIVLNKNLTITSNDKKTYTISVKNARQFEINPGYKLTITNVVFDGENYTKRTEGLFYLNESSDTNKIARLEMQSGAIVKGITVKSNANADHAPIHIQKCARFIMNDGAAILNCTNNTYHGNGGAICCDSGNVIINGGTIAGCAAKGSGGAIRVTGARNLAEDHLGVAMRGDIFLYGGYITNNVCGNTSTNNAVCYGGGIYLGDTGPMLHVIGPVVVSNNICKVRAGGTDRNPTYTLIPDDVSTFELSDDYANRLKLTGGQAGLKFMGWVGVRYPDLRSKNEEEKAAELKKVRFGGVWEYATTTHEESRNFFWNGDNRYRGWMKGNALTWTRHNIYQLPRDQTTVLEALTNANPDYPIYIEFNDGYIMDKVALNDSHIRVRNGLEVTFDLQGHSITCNLEVAKGGSVTFCDSSTNRSGRVWGYRDVDSGIKDATSGVIKDPQAYTNAYRIEGGSYRTKPDPAWVVPECVVIGNYCEVHPWMVARLAWETNLTSRIADVTLYPLESATNEIRHVTYNADTGKCDIDEISYSSGDWTLNAHTNANQHVRVLAAPAVLNLETSQPEEIPNARVAFFDSGAGGILDSGNISFPENGTVQESRGGTSYGREDTFLWNAASFGLVKMIHITYKKSNAGEVTNNIETAYFQFPAAAFEATQRKAGEGKLPIMIVDSLLASLGYNRAQGFSQNDVNTNLDTKQDNGLRKWENIVTGTDENQLLLSTVGSGENDLSLNVALTDADKVGRGDTGYTVKYDIRKSTADGWVHVGEIKDNPSFSVPLLDAQGTSLDASGFYRVTTLIIPNNKLSVTNEIPSTNIVGVLEVKSSLANTLTAVPWVSLAADPAQVEAVKVSNYVHTAHLSNNDAVQVADKGYIYRMWKWNETGNRQWDESTTVTTSGASSAPKASEYPLERNSAVWVTRAATNKPFFLIGQYAAGEQKLTIAAGAEKNSVCTLVPNPSLEDVKVNDYEWGSNPHKDDLIRIPNGQNVPILLQWKNGAWGRWVYNPATYRSEWCTDQKIPAGTGFFYQRCGTTPFELKLPASVPAGE